MASYAREMKDTDKAFRLVVHWTCFGPHHVARLTEASSELKQFGISVIGMEMTGGANFYAWKPDRASAVFERHVVFPSETFEHVSRIKYWFGVISALDMLDPDAVAINGYSYYDAWGALVWCKLHRRPAILMSDSKSDDAPRLCWKEWIKKQIVNQYDAALCAGHPQRAYLADLGMNPEKVACGLDAVDNNYFWQNAELTKRRPNSYSSLRGLESVQPFFLASSRFVRRKNLGTVIRAYADYRRICTEELYREPWRLVILGDGVERRALEDMVDAESIGDVTFAGFCEKRWLPAYYGLAKVFVHPAFQDQWGLVVNEAMASGLPVLVSTGAGCAADLVEEGRNGYVFHPEDTETLTRLLLLMSSDQVDLQSMGSASREKIAAWGPKRFAEGLHEALKYATMKRTGRPQCISL